MNNLKIFQKISNEYEEIRNENTKIEEERKREVYEKIPELQSIEQEINQIGIRASLASLKGKDTEISKDELKNLKNLRDQLLLANGYDVNYLDKIYTCKNCKDTGISENGKRCFCMEQKMAKELYKMSNLDYTLKKENFETFDINIFSNETYIEGEKSPRQNMEDILNISWRFISTFEKANDMNLLFYGSTGQGKTFLVNSIAKELLDSGINVVYQTAWEIFDMLEKRRFRRDEDFDELKFTMLIESQLLIIDDLGSEFANTWLASEIFNILNSRMLKGKKTIISTNLEPKELSERYSQRVFSRVYDKFFPIKFYGPDLRWERK